MSTQGHFGYCAQAVCLLYARGVLYCIVLCRTVWGLCFGHHTVSHDDCRHLRCDSLAVLPRRAAQTLAACSPAMGKRPRATPELCLDRSDRLPGPRATPALGSNVVPGATACSQAVVSRPRATPELHSNRLRPHATPDIAVMLGTPELDGALAVSQGLQAGLEPSRQIPHVLLIPSWFATLADNSYSLDYISLLDAALVAIGPQGSRHGPGPHRNVPWPRRRFTVLYFYVLSS